ncbi:hypothetical protein AX16_000768 [Volvariella volvacea WC 439]|nr:hypothetical protein AX16_000768 [Volvariella volvacea WC 439]
MSGWKEPWKDNSIGGILQIGRQPRILRSKLQWYHLETRFLFIAATLFVLNIPIIHYWSTRPTQFLPQSLLTTLDVIYPITFVTNVLTTGLIAYRILRQHQHSQRSGIQPSNSRLSLFSVVRIIIESAAVYTLEVLILIILYFLQHRGQFVVQSMIVPTVGIVFSLVAVRLHMTNTQTNRNKSTLFNPGWLDNSSLSRVDESSNPGESIVLQEQPPLELKIKSSSLVTPSTPGPTTAI